MRNSRGGKLGCSRLKPHTYVKWFCRICGNEVDTNKLNQHFMRAHPDIYYAAYPGRLKVKNREQGEGEFA